MRRFIIFRALVHHIEIPQILFVTQRQVDIFQKLLNHIQTILKRKKQPSDKRNEKLTIPIPASFVKRKE